MKWVLGTTKPRCDQIICHKAPLKDKCTEDKDDRKEKSELMSPALAKNQHKI
jgi:hypothetical protein